MRDKAKSVNTVLRLYVLVQAVPRDHYSGGTSYSFRFVSCGPSLQHRSRTHSRRMDISEITLRGRRGRIPPSLTLGVLLFQSLHVDGCLISVEALGVFMLVLRIWKWHTSVNIVSEFLTSDASIRWRYNSWILSRPRLRTCGDVVLALYTQVSTYSWSFVLNGTYASYPVFWVLITESVYRVLSVSLYF